MMNHHTTREPSVDLSDLLRGWKTVLITTGIAMAAGAALLMSITPHQQVSAKIIVQPREVALDGRTGTASRDKEFLPTQSEIFQSPAVIEDAVQRISDSLSAEMLPGRISGIARNLKVDPLAGTSILVLRYTDRNAYEAAEILNALILSYTEYLARTEKQQHYELMLALKQRDTDLRNTLSNLQSEFEQLKQSQRLSPGADAAAMSRIIAGLEEALATTRSRLITLEHAALRMSSQGRSIVTMTTEAVRDVELDMSQDSAGVRLILNELAAMGSAGGMPSPAGAEDRLRLAQSRVDALSQTLGPNHPDLQAAKAGVRSADAELQQLVRTAPGILRQTLETTRLQEQELQTRYDTHLRSSQLNEVTRLKEQQKLAEIQRAQQAYETVNAQLQHWQMADQAMAGGRAGIAVSVLEPPTPGKESFAGNPLIVLGIAGLLGLMCGVFLLIAKPQIRQFWAERPGQVPSAGFSPTV